MRERDTHTQPVQESELRYLACHGEIKRVMGMRVQLHERVTLAG